MLTRVVSAGTGVVSASTDHMVAWYGGQTEWWHWNGNAGAIYIYIYIERERERELTSMNMPFKPHS